MAENKEVVDDGGPAFPEHNVKTGILGDAFSTTTQSGMSLRDYLAAHALQGYRASRDRSGDEPEVLARRAYDDADAMIKESKRVR